MRQKDPSFLSSERPVSFFLFPSFFFQKKRRRRKPSVFLSGLCGRQARKHTRQTTTSPPNLKNGKPTIIRSRNNNVFLSSIVWSKPIQFLLSKPISFFFFFDYHFNNLPTPSPTSFSFHIPIIIIHVSSSSFSPSTPSHNISFFFFFYSTDITTTFTRFNKISNPPTCTTHFLSKPNFGQRNYLHL